MPARKGSMINLLLFFFSLINYGYSLRCGVNWLQSRLVESLQRALKAAANVQVVDPESMRAKSHGHSARSCSDLFPHVHRQLMSF